MDNQQDANQLPTPRRFIYRSAAADSAQPHPLRRATDVTHPFRTLVGDLSPSAILLQFRVYMKLN